METLSERADSLQTLQKESETTTIPMTFATDGTTDQTNFSAWSVTTLFYRLTIKQKV